MCSYKDRYRGSHVEVEAGRCEGSQADTDVQENRQTDVQATDVQAGEQMYRQQMYRQQMYRLASRCTGWRADVQATDVQAGKQMYRRQIKI
jgi:hypothetical protein